MARGLGFLDGPEMVPGYRAKLAQLGAQVIQGTDEE